MKTVKGRVLSSQPISIFAAAKALSHFAASDNGTTQAVSVYLRRASDAFKELAALHRELRGPKSERKHKNKVRSDTSRSTEYHTEPPRKPKKERHCRDSEGVAEFDSGAFVEVAEEDVAENRKQTKKMRKSDEVLNGEIVDPAERKIKKKRRKSESGKRVEEIQCVDTAVVLAD